MCVCVCEREELGFCVYTLHGSVKMTHLVLVGGGGEGISVGVRVRG